MWVIHGLGSDALIGLDFMDQHPTAIDTGLKMVAVDAESVPVRMDEWNESMDRHHRKPIDDVTMFPATTPSQMGLELPVKVLTEVPECWEKTTLLFAPSRSFFLKARA